MHGKARLLSAIALLSLPAGAEEPAAPIETIIVTNSHENLIGVSDTASQGSITQEEIALRPVYRVGQLLESMGLVVTVHSGEGKANQYLMRGFNLDHGTDMANFVDDMPVNRPTNAHGQGYSDLNFVMPQILQGIDFTKGPYYASIGDFGAVGSEHMKLAEEIPDQMQTSIDSLGNEDVFVGGTRHFDNGGKLLGGLDLGHMSGPWTYSDNFRRIQGVLRYSQDDLDITALYYKGQGRNTTDIPLRAVQEGLIGVFGSLDPSDGNRSERWSLSAHDSWSGDDWQLKANVYAIHSTMTLWNDFTHYLNDPVNGDQEQQDETRGTYGGALAYTRPVALAGLQADVTAGLQERHDDIFIDRRHTANRVVLSYCNDGGGDYSVGLYSCSADRVQVNDVSPYIENTTHWLSWLRSTIGVREDYYSGHDRSLLTGFSGTANEWLTQPKGSIVFGPFYDTEFYASAGKGFHSDDLRGVLGSVPLEGTQLSLGKVALMAKANGQEIGFRNNSIDGLQIQFVAFREDFSSELTYDQEAGEDQANAPSRREGVELSAQYHPLPWLEINTDLATTHAKYFKNAITLANTYGITGGTNIANAPDFIGSFGVLVDNLGNWFGGMQERILGPYPLTDGPAKPSGAGYKETNVTVGYKLTPAVKLQLSVYNLFDTKAYAAEYYYTTAIRPTEAPTADYQVHPLEPISARLTATVLF
ncbi:MAG TPA: TonB-dependent receptor plug domain-containing protein [Magnetospirillaceae bacterium]|nr:TonB-dependent receptor plug domain-containing protein [Magnetospirillaceae bacterium]